MPKKVNIRINLAEIGEKFNQDEPSGKLGLSLLDRAIFMQGELIRLEEEIAKTGSITTMCQGSYSIDRINPAVNAYNGMIKNFTSVIKQIKDLMPTEEDGEDPFDTFE